MDNDKINWDDYNFNFDGEFPTPPQPTQPQTMQPQPRRSGSFSIDELRRLHEEGSAKPAYDAARTAAPYDAPYVPQPETEQPAPQPKRKKHGFGRFLKRLLIVLLVLVLLTAAVLLICQKMPKTDDPIGTRKKDCCTVLLAGTDESGMRTDTLMVMYISRAEKSIRLLSIPRDTMVNRDNPVPKINGAYYANGAGEVGMDYLMDYVKDVIGYRPDGYLLIDLNCFEDLVNLMGGVKFDVPMDMHYEDPTQDLFIDLKEGTQRLSGKEAMWLVRFRSGYAAADLQRVSVQRDFVKAALDQWGKAWNVIKAPAALVLLQKNTLTDLKWNNITWLGISAVLCGTDGFETETLPGEGAYVNGGAYYVEDRAAAAALVNEKFNPYETEITADELHPYGH